MGLDEIIEMSGGCLWTIIRGTVEIDSKEPWFDLIGRREIDTEKGKIVYRIIEGYPILTAKMKPTSLDYGNNAARKRSIQMNTALIKLKMPYRIIGQGHNHIHSRKGEDIDELSEHDIEGAKKAMKSLSLRYYFLALIGELKRHKYKKPRDICLDIHPEDSEVIVNFNYSSKRGIELHLRGFKVVKRKDKKEGSEKVYVEKQLPLEIFKISNLERESLSYNL